MKTANLLLLLLSGATLTLAGCGKDQEKPKYALKVTDDGQGTAVATVGDVEAATVEQGASVTLTATPKAGYAFGQWTVESGGIMLSPHATTNPATFTMPAEAVNVKAEFIEAGVVINGVTWAMYNVDAPGTFTAKAEDDGMFYQWNRKIGWSTKDPLTSSPAGQTWDETVPQGDSWESANDPCPAGWRLPNSKELSGILEAAKVSNEWTSVNGVYGRNFTDKASGATVFFPASSLRDPAGKLVVWTTVGNYWSSSTGTEHTASILGVKEKDEDTHRYATSRHNACSVRCVLDQ